MYFSLFSLINVCILGVTRQTAFYAPLSIAYPFFLDPLRCNFVFLCFNLGISLIFISAVIRLCEQQILLGTCIFSRTSREKSFIYLFKHLLKNITAISFIKVICDTLFGQMNGSENIISVAMVWLSTYATVIIWSLIAFILVWFHVPIKWVYFFLGFGVLISQYFSQYIGVLSLLVFGSPFSMNNQGVWIALKIVLIVALIILNLAIVKKHEYINAKVEI